MLMDTLIKIHIVQKTKNWYHLQKQTDLQYMSGFLELIVQQFS